MKRLFFSLLLVSFIALTGCGHLMPSSEISRKDRVFNSTGEAEQAFDTVLLGLDKNATGEKELRELNFGTPHSSEETVGPLRIPLTLSGNNGDKAFDMLPEKVRKCIALENAASDCKMLFFSDRENRRQGVGQNVAGRAFGIAKHDLVSMWWWRAYFIMERFEGDFRVIHKQFEKSDDKDVNDDKTMTILDDTVDLESFIP